MKRLLIAFALLLAAFSSAQAQIVNTLPFNLQNNTTADATQVMADFLQIVNNVNTNAAKNGSNNDITALLALTTPVTPTQGGSTVYAGGTSTGSANAQVITVPVPTGFSLAINKRIVFTAGYTNTGTTTFNIAGTGATNVYKLTPTGSSALTGGEIVTGSIVEAIYDGTQYQLVTNNLALLGPLTSLASASPDFGTISSHNINLTGTTTITSFGSTASTIYPVYYFKLAGAITFTYNGTSMILPGALDIVGAAGDTGMALYLGSGNWQVTAYTKLNGQPVIAAGTPLCGAIGFTMGNNSGTPNSSIDMAAGQAVMLTTGGVSISASSVAITVNTTVNGANGLDAGSKGNSTWYNFYLINNGTTTAGLASTSATAPTMPSGYTYKCRLGAMRTDGSGNFLRSLQQGAVTQYKITASSNVAVAPNIVSGIAGTVSLTSPTLATASVSNVVPSTAVAIEITAYNNYTPTGLSNVLIAPSTAWGGTNNGPQGSAGQVWPVYLSHSGGQAESAVVWMNLETTSIAWASDAGGGAISTLAWRDKVNAN